MTFAAGGCFLLILAVVAFFPRQANRTEVALKTEAKQVHISKPKMQAVALQPTQAVKPIQKASQPGVSVLSKNEESAVKSTSSTPRRPVAEKSPEPSVKMTHSVQVGAFRNRKGAQKLVGMLERKNCPAGILAVIDSQNRIWFTVRIGNFPSREAAVRYAVEFTSREKMETAVRPFKKL